MKKLLALLIVSFCATEASAGFINVYEPDAHGNPTPGVWSVQSNFAAAVHINSASAERLDFTYTGSTDSARTQLTVSTLVDALDNIDDDMAALQRQGLSTVRVIVNSYDLGSGGPDFLGVGTLETNGLNFMISIPLVGGGSDNLYLDSSENAPVPAPSTLVMLASGFAGLGLNHIIRLRRSKKSA